jgi:hypothetical protein
MRGPCGSPETLLLGSDSLKRPLPLASLDLSPRSEERRGNRISLSRRGFLAPEFCFKPNLHHDRISTFVRSRRRWLFPARSRSSCGKQVARMEQSAIRERSISFNVDPGFHGACHRAGHFGPDPLVPSGLRKNEKRKRKRNAVRRCSVTTAALRAAARTQLRARTASGVPPRLLPEGLTHPKAQLGPGFARPAPVDGGGIPPGAGPG